jgi:hypothetical protein
MEEDIKFIHVLRSIKKSTFVLDRLCNGEVTWKRDYGILSIKEIKGPECFLTVYRFAKGITKTPRVEIMRRHTDFIRSINQGDDCTIIAQKNAIGQLIDITLASIELFRIPVTRVDETTLKILRKRSADYDSLAPLKIIEAPTEPVVDKVVTTEVNKVLTVVKPLEDIGENSESDDESNDRDQSDESNDSDESIL